MTETVPLAAAPAATADAETSRAPRSYRADKHPDLSIAPPAPRISPWLMDPIRDNAHIYTQVAVAAVMINLFSLATSLFSMTVYNRIVPNNATQSLVALSIGDA